MRSDIVIFGAGPAGLTAAYELVHRSSLKITVIEAEDAVGGLARTIEHNGNRMDLGGHRFYSKSGTVVDWWKSILPFPGEENDEKVLLERKRVSRIYFKRRFFDYPIKPGLPLLKALGLGQSLRILCSYLCSAARPIKPERSLEDFFINRFGKELYLLFFKSYTEKVWGQRCCDIKPEWGAQRIKGLSIGKALLHSIMPLTDRSSTQQKTETSLIERFFYPRMGPGQLWEEVSRRTVSKGGQILLGHKVIGTRFDGKRIISATIDGPEGRFGIEADYFVSTIPLAELIGSMAGPVPPAVSDIARRLPYRDFISVGLLLRNLRTDSGARIKDNWIYIQDREVQVGRIQIFNNWSESLVADPALTWVGMEYFTSRGDALWQRDDASIAELARGELETLGFIDKSGVLDCKVVKVHNAYPGYFGSYEEMPVLRSFLDEVSNLWPIGRNGMHRYNNQDHSMLSAMAAVECILSGNQEKECIWSVNTEKEYHEERTAA